MRAFRAVASSLLVAATVPLAAAAQPAGDGTFPLGVGAPVLTVDQEELFAGSLFGQRVAEEVEAASRALAAENRRLEQQLAEEERELTERRSELLPEEFRELADAFDARVEQIRREQEAKGRALAELREGERQRFFGLALPVLAQIVVDAGAVAVLESRSVFLAVDEIDITERAIARLDAEIGTGADEAPDTDPDLESEANPPPPAEGDPPLELPDAPPAE